VVERYERSPAGVVTFTRQGIVLELNEAAASLLGTDRARAPGVALVALGSFIDASLALRHVEAGAAAVEAVSVDLELRTRAGGRRWLRATSRGVDEPDGGRVCLTVLVDVTQALEGRQAAQHLASSALALTASLDPAHVVAELTRAAVPFVADLAVVDLLVPTGLRRRAAMCHAEAAKAERFRRAEERWGPLPNVSFATLQALQTRRPQLIPEVPPRYLEAAAVDDEHLVELVGLVVRSWAVVPVVHPREERAVAVLRLATTGVRAALGAPELDVAEQLARLSAQALANAWEHEALRAARGVNRAASEASMVGKDEGDASPAARPHGNAPRGRRP
jgi:PAS domain S-box-containing protein